MCLKIEGGYYFFAFSRRRLGGEDGGGREYMCSLRPNGAAEGHVLASDPVDGDSLSMTMPYLLGG